MTRQVVSRTLILSVASLVLVGVGCFSGRTTNRTTLCRGELDECREVTLSYDVVHDREELWPVRKYEQLTLIVSPREKLRAEHPVKTIELKFGVPREQLRFENIEARTDATRQRVWFIERDSGRIIATLDRQTGQTTGPDDQPPAWATPDGGAPL